MMEIRVLVIDNHDSFVYNITGLLERIKCGAGMDSLIWQVRGCDDTDPGEVCGFDAVILSPGPGLPSEAGRLSEIVARCAEERVPVFGICLGFQAIAEYMGARLVNMPEPRHGHLSRLYDIDAGDPVMGVLASGHPAVGRYHSWVVDPRSVPESLVPTSFDEEGNIMSLRHAALPMWGTQFHPESVITECGESIMQAFLHACAPYARPHV